MMTHIHVMHSIPINIEVGFSIFRQVWTRNFWKALENTIVDEEPFEMKTKFSNES